MPCFTKSLIRLGVVGTVLGAGTLLVAGPDRIGALIQQTTSTVHSAIDGAIDDPIALRAQLRDLEGQYPEKIAEVRGDLAELQEQRAQLERDLEVGKRVVRLAEADLPELGALISRAEDASSESGYRVVRVRFENRSFDVESAYQKAASIRNLRDAYASRTADTERDLGFLGEQGQRLTELLAQLEAEQTEFQSQIWQLDRQIDAIARNERMIDMMEKRQATIDRHSRYRADSLDQLKARLADLRAQKESQLRTLTSASTATTYEEQAKMSLEHRGTRAQPWDFEKTSSTDRFGDVIEITPDHLDHVEIEADHCDEDMYETTSRF